MFYFSIILFSVKVFYNKGICAVVISLELSDKNTNFYEKKIKNLRKTLQMPPLCLLKPVYN